MKEIIFSGAKEYSLNLRIWDEVENPKGIVQISHGMAEHIARYDNFAEFLNKNGYIVLGDDHRAHGKTSGGKYGVTPKGGNCFKDTVQDLIMITNYAKETYNLPLILFGHSYGSFLAQSYIQKASNLINGVVLSGSAKQSGILPSLGKALAMGQCLFADDDKPAKFLDKLIFGGNNNKFSSENKEFAWLTRDDVERQKYIDDEACGVVMSLGFFKSFFSGLTKLYKETYLNCIRKTLPIYIVSGDKDPVGDCGKLVNELYNTYNDIAIKNVEMKLYGDARHEILNETNRDECYEDILKFCDANIAEQ